MSQANRERCAELVKQMEKKLSSKDHSLVWLCTPLKCLGRMSPMYMCYIGQTKQVKQLVESYPESISLNEILLTQ